MAQPIPCHLGGVGHDVRPALGRGQGRVHTWLFSDVAGEACSALGGQLLELEHAGVSYEETRQKAQQLRACGSGLGYKEASCGASHRASGE